MKRANNCSIPTQLGGRKTKIELRIYTLMIHMKIMHILRTDQYYATYSSTEAARVTGCFISLNQNEENFLLLIVIYKYFMSLNLII